MDSHPALSGWPIKDGNLLVGGVPLTRLAQRVGQTPFYAYDRARLRARIGELRTHLPEGLDLHYAIKANPMPALVGYLGGLVDGFDVASGGELTVALNAGMPTERIGFAGPGKTDSELSQAIAAEIVIEIESRGELSRLEVIASNLGLVPRIALRINPDFELKGSGMRMGGGAQQFGLDAEMVPAVIADARSRGLAIQGFHIFAGSQNLNADIIAEVQGKTLELALGLADNLAEPLRYLNMGGGFGIPYFPKDKPLDLGHVGENLSGIVAKLATKQPDARPVLELGRYIVGEAGLYVTKILDRKESRGEVFLVVDGGLHHHLAASGNFGQVIRRNYPVAIVNRMAETTRETASVVGCLCTPIDLLANKADLPRSEVGDLVAIFQSGAYGMSASPTAFLGHPPPGEILV
jgi:diaminopimelate decarboxylase